LKVLVLGEDQLLSHHYFLQNREIVAIAQHHCAVAVNVELVVGLLDQEGELLEEGHRETQLVTFLEKIVEVL
jgi:hypothetical protein